MACSRVNLNLADVRHHSAENLPFDATVFLTIQRGDVSRSKRVSLLSKNQIREMVKDSDWDDETY
jgi:hypothetical protein